MATDTPATATTRLHDLGKSLWLDNITRGLLRDGTLRRYIQECSVTGLTSNPTIFDHAIEHRSSYDDAIRQRIGEATTSKSGALVQTSQSAKASS
jgi:transaldolase